jgi:lipopolysaccharide exporter
LDGRGAARSERADVDTGEAHDQLLDGADRQDGPSLTAQAASGLRWSSVGCSALMVANLLYIVTSSRLLDPDEFGLMALAQLVVLFALFFPRMGLASALVQKPALSRDDIRAASTAGIAIGIVCFGLNWVLAPLVGEMFRASDLPPVQRLLGVIFLFEGLVNVGTGLLRRQLRFRELTQILVGTYAFGYLVVTIGLALLGAGVWSLVVGALVSSVSQMVWQYALLRHPIRPVLRREPYREVCGYGMRLTGAHMLDYVGGNLDTFTVGRYAGTAVVGQYSRGYYLAFQPLRFYLTQALTTVLFPHLSQIQHDATRLRRAFVSVLALGGILVFPLCAGMAVAARELVLLLLGPQWSLAATVVPWFALAGGCSVMSALSQTVAEARADLYRSLAVQAAYIMALAAFLAVALQHRSHGIWVFAAAVAAAEVLRHAGYLGLMRRVVGLSITQVWASYAPAAFASAGVALAMAVIRRALATEAPTLVTFAAEVAAGACALSLCIRFCPLPAIRRELRMRLTEAGVLGGVGGLRWRLAPLVLGRPDPRS